MNRLILASASPRRRELLEKAGFSFTILPLKVSEIPDKTLNVREQILDIAGRKAKAAREQLLAEGRAPFVVLGSDTEVVLDNRTLGKPEDASDAAKTLAELSGTRHEVITAIVLIDEAGVEKSHLETTWVQFRKLTSQEIDEYVATGEPMDKAGSYAIQGAGRALVESVDGDFDNVVGLPVRALTHLIAEAGWEFRSPLSRVRAQITEACLRSGRDPASVRLVAVSKKQPAGKIAALRDEGQTDFGENYVQEFTEKAANLTGIRWHLIGHLQTNKVKEIVGRCDLIHSVDSYKLAEALSKRATAGRPERILLQLNVGGEASKEGFAEISEDEWSRLCALPGLEIHGLMTMPPLQNSAGENRVHFRALKAESARLRALPAPERHPLTELSMGTSSDFEVAVEEGATLVRVGSLLFGPRS